MLQKLLSFNENAFGFTRNFIIPEKDYAELSVGETRLSFASKKFAESKGFTQSKVSDKPLGFKLGFTTKNVEETIAKAASAGAGATIIEQLITKLCGQIVAYMRDIDGFLIEICTPVTD